MDSLRIEGGVPLKGEIVVSASRPAPSGTTGPCADRL